MPRSTAATQAPRTRQTQEERRRQTQARVLEASVEVVLEKGFSGLTTTDVAERAGVSRGAQAHYFRTREDLLLAALKYMAQDGTKLTIANAERARATDDPLEGFIQDAEQFFFGRNYPAWIDLMVASRTKPDFRERLVPAIVEWRRDVNETWLAVFSEIGIPDDQATQILQFTNNLLRGMALTSLWDDDRETRDMLLENWRSRVREMAQGRAAGDRNDRREA